MRTLLAFAAGFVLLGTLVPIPLEAQAYPTQVQIKRILVNRDIVQMVRAKVSESTILEAINASPTDFDISGTGIAALKNAGITETIIQAMIAASSAPKQTVRVITSLPINPAPRADPPPAPPVTVTPPTQQTATAINPSAAKMTNEDVIELAGLGLSDDIVIDKIYAAKATDFDTSIGGLKALKAGKVSDAVIRAMINPLNPTSQTSVGPAEGPTGGEQAPEPAPQPASKPRIFFQSASYGNTQNASRSQSMEMSKDFERDCPGIQITLAQQMADYTIALNHIEVGLIIRDNQIQVANKNGDLISTTKEGGSIRGGMKKACSLILADWSTKR